MTRAELRQLVRELTLVEEHEASNTLVDAFLEEGYAKLVRRKNWSWLLQPPEVFAPTGWPFDLNANALVSPVLAIYDIVEVNEYRLPLSQVTRSEMTFFFNGPIVGIRPRVYTLENGQLYVFPETEDTSYRISYYGRLPWAAGDAVEAPAPVDYQMATLVNFAASRIWERQEDFDRADAYLARYDVGVGEMINFENTRKEDRPKIFGEIAGARGSRPNMPWLDGVA